MNNETSLVSLPATAKAGDFISLTHEKVQSMTGVYSIQFVPLAGGAVHVANICRQSESYAWFTVPYVQPGEYNIKGTYPAQSPIKDPLIGTLRIVV
ncbi:MULTISPECIES: hypothetical protein [Pseudomonas]|uniref:hypothetical protein n=1 Tax=Pseudomonas TaxID=286 RepID=UPI0011AFB811|nr:MULTISPECIES: hypothetical protein [unclassified Pseudomonas]